MVGILKDRNSYIRICTRKERDKWKEIDRKR